MIHSTAGRRGFTTLEMLVVLAIVSLLASIVYPVLTRAMRSTLQVTGRASMQGEMRLSLDWVTRDLHQAHVVMGITAGPQGALAMFRTTDTAVTAPESVVEANRADPSGLPQFPFAGDAAAKPLPDGRRLTLPGSLVRYRVDPQSRQLVRASAAGRLAGAVSYDAAARRTTVSAWTFEAAGSPAQETVVAANVSRFEPIALAYDSAGFLSRAAGDVTSACAVAVTLEAAAVVEGDKPDKPVVETAATKAWLWRRLTAAAHPGAAAAFDEQLDY